MLGRRRPRGAVGGDLPAAGVMHLEPQQVPEAVRQERARVAAVEGFRRGAADEPARRKHGGQLLVSALVQCDEIEPRAHFAAAACSVDEVQHVPLVVDAAREVSRREILVDAANAPEHLDAVRLFWASLEERGEADEYWDAARRYMKSSTVLFTGYLTHREMAWLLPCCDVGVFPSMVIESGPLVFLESLASGVFPVGTYFGGMRVKIDRVAPSLEEGHAALMKVRPDADHIVTDLAGVLPQVLGLGAHYRAQLRRVAEEHYDWRARTGRVLPGVAPARVGLAAPRRRRSSPTPRKLHTS